ncbi:Serine/threonine-protein kinase pkn3 [Minicystis rosea]|nr:Serine/threonine-protein kinase pkn3 [Minicystis rosea]
MNDLDIDSLLPKGTVLSGKYEVARVLGRGGMGVVVEARHLKMKRDVALKILLPALRSQHDVVARFEREARAAAQLQDKHVARVLDVDTLPDGSPFMVMELLRGRDLGEHLAERGKLPYREAVGYLLEACTGMVEAHRAGIVHRDLKPNNLFLDQQGDRVVLKILDFGISKITDETNASMTATTTVFGTPLYMSPEQVRSTKNVDARADIWSLGIVIYELLAGEPPFSGPSAPAIIAAIIADRCVPIGDVRPDLPPGLAAAVMRALEKSPDARYPDVQSFAAALAPFGPDGRAPAALPLSPSPSPMGPADAATNMPVGAATQLPSNGRGLLGIAVGMGVALGLGGLVLMAVITRERPVSTPADREAVKTTTAIAPPVVAPIETAAPVVSASATVAPSVTASPTVAPTSKTVAPVVKSAAPPPDKPTAKPVTPVAPKPPQSDDPKYL